MPPIETGSITLGLVALVAYLLGAVPFGVVMARVFGLGDLRQIGSGNIGATNVLRTGSKLAAALTLVFDAAKGGVAVLIARALFGEDAAQVAGLAAFLGHLFPVYLGFRGGKGVATFLGVVLALSFQVGLACCATWLVVAAALRYSSMAALFSAALTPIWLLLFDEGRMLVVSFILVVLVYIRHGDNLKRLKAGTEPKIGASKT